MLTQFLLVSQAMCPAMDVLCLTRPALHLSMLPLHATAECWWLRSILEYDLDREAAVRLILPKKTFSWSSDHVLMLCIMVA